jgi:gas vesicle protein
MENEIKDESTSAGWYLLGGLIIGAAAGLLLAPKKGSETREDIGEWRRRSREKAMSVIARIGDVLPTQVKAAAAVGAVKGGANEAFHESRDKAKQFLGS